MGIDGVHALAGSEGGAGARAVYLSAGKGPPKPPPKSRIGLTDVERAISVLDGRHPDHEKVARQTREATERRRDEIAIELARNARARRLRRVVLALASITAAAVAVVGWRLAQRARALHAALGDAEAPWLARGFFVRASNELTGWRAIDADLPASTCFVALSTSSGPLRVEGDGGEVEGSRSIAWCTCRPGHVTLEAAPPLATETTGLAVLALPAATLGGPLARSWVDFTPGAWGDRGQECAVATLDAWIDAHRSHPAEALRTADTAGNGSSDAEAADLDAPWLGPGSRRELRGAGWKVIAAVDPTHPFAVVNARPGACAMAVAASNAELSLRDRGGARPVTHARGALAWCSPRAETFSVWREGTAPVAVLAVEAPRIGGILGARESAEAAGLTLPPEATWLRADDLSWDAGALLRASGGTDVTTAPLPAEAGPPDARVIALSLSFPLSAASPSPPSSSPSPWSPLAAGTSVVATPDGVAIACDPPRAPGVRQTLCAQVGPLSWFNKKDAAAGAARASLPVWLSTLRDRKEVDAMARIPELLTLTRRLARQGFEATALEGVTELPEGVRVVGRAGEDAIVAVGLVPQPPWVLPYTNGLPWDLGDAPRVVPLKPGESVKLKSSPMPNAPLGTRRTVVFRRAVAP
jgi:hypothetical protein